LIKKQINLMILSKSILSNHDKNGNLTIYFFKLKVFFILDPILQYVSLFLVQLNAEWFLRWLYLDLFNSTARPQVNFFHICLTIL
jgi:hypothetical protein